MNVTPYLHLLWKEYRAIRLFWICIVALVVLLQWLTAITSDVGFSAPLIFNFALGAPILFAAGCAGTAFAMEKEEGTFDFLRAAPVKAWQVLTSKLGITILATAAMFLLLWPITLMRSSIQQLPAGQLNALLGFWLIAAVEAIAWGTLFSLLTARPLLSVVMAFAAGSIVAESLAMMTEQHNLYELRGYLLAAPGRLLVAGAVLLVDIALGLRWLQNGPPPMRRLMQSTKTTLSNGKGDERAANQIRINNLVLTRTPGAMLGRLLWQGYRQSAWLMVLMSFLFLSAGTGLFTWRRVDSVPNLGDLVIIPAFLAIIASLMGSFVFLADQERRRYLFFVEHNGPPRYVWFARQMPWLFAIVASIWLVSLVWPNTTHPPSGSNIFEREPLEIGIVVTAVSYAAGQWLSMHVRSGILAGFFGLLLSGLLCCWTILMYTMEVSIWWSVVPIPVVLMAATWLRAPDWIRENTTWSARGHAAAAVLIPAAVLCVAVPIFRAHQIPLESPGFDPQKFLAEITPEDLAAGELYRKANDLFVPMAPLASEAEQAVAIDAYQNREPSPHMKQWLDQNADALAAVLEASEHPRCFFGNPGTQSYVPVLPKAAELISLVILSGWQLEREGNLDEAFDRYLAALRISNVFSGLAPSSGQSLFREIGLWGAHHDQTSETIRSAVRKLQALDSETLQLDDRIKSDYILRRRFLMGDRNLIAMYRNFNDELIWGRLMPWENYRALRVLNMLTAAALDRLQQMRSVLSQQDQRLADQPTQGVSDFLQSFPYITYSNPADSHNLNRIFLSGYFDAHPLQILIDMKNTLARISSQRAIPIRDKELLKRGSERGSWLATTWPNLENVGSQGMWFASQLTEFELHRRATVIVLALEAYRLDHGELPDKLSDLVGSVLDRLPLDPLSGSQFEYHPETPATLSAPEINRQVWAFPIPEPQR